MKEDREIVITRENTSRAISEVDYQEWGCPECGYREAKRLLKGASTRLMMCESPHCGVHFLTLAKGVKKSTIGLNGSFPELESHPRKGMHSSRHPHPKPENMTKADLIAENTVLRSEVESHLDLMDKAKVSISQNEQVRRFMETLESRGASWWQYVPWCSKSYVLYELKKILGIQPEGSVPSDNA